MRHLSRIPGPVTVLLVAVLAATAWAGDGPPPTLAQQLGPPAGAQYVGSETCLDCHDDIGDFFKGSPHHPARGATVPGTDIGSCEACHGPGSLHVAAGDGSAIVGSRQLSGLSDDQKVAMCLQCHTDKRAAWYDGDHAGSGITCADCHTDQAHFVSGGVKPWRAFRASGEFCLQCHQDQTWKFRLQYHHPVLEGEIGCVDCHSPHGDEALQVTAGQRENRACYGCHGEVAGPFVFEHEAVQADACATCHDPHGSPNDRLLRQDDNSLCLRCHYTPEFPVIGDTDHAEYLGRRARCYDCHADIHGSNVDEHFLKP